MRESNSTDFGPVCKQLLLVRQLEDGIERRVVVTATVTASALQEILEEGQTAHGAIQLQRLEQQTQLDVVVEHFAVDEAQRLQGERLLSGRGRLIVWRGIEQRAVEQAQSDAHLIRSVRRGCKKRVTRVNQTTERLRFAQTDGDEEAPAALAAIHRSR